ncbi:hypothetical protein RBU61_07050 [Tissierella sp. MB52-C2]|uniref:YfjL-like protein n=1 Tax=Tissierella sp. MB52-C2 TaxID=3070999 RepID=UPI00280AD282|nr:hypothetical protein [Tissierella sp. MB52-C2]WMM26421.1 hypothetical protein RBU61_07050 [Tissierella sp. MB52-C2]
MKNTKNKILKILAGLIAILLIGGILFITNAFVGNPISARIADKAIKQYVKENYSFLDLELEKPIYSFKDGSYVVNARSKSSIDTKFGIHYRNGSIGYDSYEMRVLGMFNTIDRLSNEYTDLAKRIIAEELEYEENNTRVMYYKDVYENGNDALQLDIKYDRSLPIDAEVIIDINIGDTSIDNIAKILTDAHKAFVKNNCYFKKYGLFAENDGILVMVNEITPEDIESGDLINLLQKAKDYEDGTAVEKGSERKDYEERITVFIKDSNSKNE